MAIVLSFCYNQRIMKTIAIIAELNPLHNGHARLFEEARRQSGADTVLVLMSGDFVQRGEPALFDRFERTRMALLAGADLVLELPAAVSCGSAQRFAEGAVAILDRLQTVDELWFGSESGDTACFLETAELLAEEPPAFSDMLRSSLSEGLSFPAAREQALSACGVSEKALSLLRHPNNILGLEYCLALTRVSSQIRPHTVERKGAGHHDPGLSGGSFSSAASIRAHILSGRPFSELSGQIPPALHEQYRSLLSSSAPVCADDLSDMLLYQLLKETRLSLGRYLDVPDDLAGRILQMLPDYTGFTGFCTLLKTKERTYTQISRALLHILLGITQEDLRQALHPEFVRMLGFSGNAQPLLAGIRRKGQIRLVSKASVLSDLSYGTDLFAARLYESVRSRKSGTPFQDDFRRPVITL